MFSSPHRDRGKGSTCNKLLTYLEDYFMYISLLIHLWFIYSWNLGKNVISFIIEIVPQVIGCDDSPCVIVGLYKYLELNWLYIYVPRLELVFASLMICNFWRI